MKLLIFSDIHSDKRALQKLMDIEADLYICAGDLVSWAKGLDEMAEILKPKGEQVLLLPGNHESEADIVRVCEDYGFHNFHGEALHLDDIWVAGLGYSNPTPFNTPGEYSELDIANRLRPFAALHPLVLVCHCPPKDTDLDGVREGAHFGSTAVRQFLEEQQPLRFFCGHIHECEGRETTVGATRGWNVGKRGFLLDLDDLQAGPGTAGPA